MVLKNRDIYGFLCTSWVLITMVPRNINAAITALHLSSLAHTCCPNAQRTCRYMCFEAVMSQL